MYSVWWGEKKCSSHSIQEANIGRGPEIRHFKVRNYNVSNWLPPIAPRQKFRSSSTLNMIKNSSTN